MAFLPNGMPLPFFLKVLTPRPRSVVEAPSATSNTAATQDLHSREGLTCSEGINVDASGSAVRVKSTYEMNKNDAEDVEFMKEDVFDDDKAPLSPSDRLSPGPFSPANELFIPSPGEMGAEKKKLRPLRGGNAKMEPLEEDEKSVLTGKKAKRRKRKKDDDAETVKKSKTAKMKKTKKTKEASRGRRKSEDVEDEIYSDSALFGFMDGEVSSNEAEATLHSSIENCLKVELKDEDPNCPDGILDVNTGVEASSAGADNVKKNRRKREKTGTVDGAVPGKEDIGAASSEKKRKKYFKSTEKRFPCGFCDFRTHLKENLKRHLTIHTGLRLFACDICDKRFASKGEMTLHKKTHAGEKPYVCEMCGRAFTRAFHLLCHKRRQHPGSKGDDGLPLQLFNCEHCGKGYACKSSLTVHEKWHSGERAHRCHVCGLAFVFPSDLTKHLRRHEPRSFPCAQCDRVFVTPQERKMHEAQHTGEKPHACNTCGAAFVKRTHLENHIRIHTGDKPFECALCGRCFAQTGTLKNHMKNIHGNSSAVFSVSQTSSRSYLDQKETSFAQLQEVSTNPNRFLLPDGDSASAESCDASPLPSMFSNFTHLTSSVSPDLMIPMLK